MAHQYNQRSDRDLILACQRREPAAFEELVKRNQKAVYTLLYQLAPDWPDILDLSQEVFIRIWRSIGSVRNPVTFRSWLTKQVMQLFFEELKTRPKKASRGVLTVVEMDSDLKEPTEADLASDPTLENNENLLSGDQSVMISEAMKLLPEQWRTPLVLRELEGLNYEEIAVLTKTEVGTVQLRISRARKKLEIMLSHYLKNQAHVTEVQG